MSARLLSSDVDALSSDVDAPPPSEVNRRAEIGYRDDP
jgi:hypothetical protein